MKLETSSHMLGKYVMGDSHVLCVQFPDGDRHILKLAAKSPEDSILKTKRSPSN
jgi:hypothetical protein